MQENGETANVQLLIQVPSAIFKSFARNFRFEASVDYSHAHKYYVEISKKKKKKKMMELVGAEFISFKLQQNI